MDSLLQSAGRWRCPRTRAAAAGRKSGRHVRRGSSHARDTSVAAAVMFCHECKSVRTSRGKPRVQIGAHARSQTSVTNFDTSRRAAFGVRDVAM